jgi:hypothetical protein
MDQFPLEATMNDNEKSVDQFVHEVMQGFMAGRIGCDVWERRGDFGRIPYCGLGHAAIHEASHACVNIHYKLFPIRAEVYTNGTGKVSFWEPTADSPISEGRSDQERIADIVTGSADSGEPIDRLAMERETEELIWHLWPKILTVAAALFMKRTLTGAEILALMTFDEDEENTQIVINPAD